MNESNTLDIPSQSVDLLYYDGACPLCRREMSVLARLKTPGLELVDIHGLADERHPARYFPTKAELLQVLHLRRSNQEWVKGVEANVAAWSHTRIGFLWRLLTIPGLRWLTDKVYYSWAERRYARLYCAVKPEVPTQ
ncbi:MAG: putative DCC family thiol-disulfide oxidoreductase YuxK [Candidatus Azotimanducaceae bacterium]|jgi:predicted DCC family thiol-disulfide oxidoreductase YuxK